MTESHEYLTTREVAERLGMKVSRLDWLERYHLDPRVWKFGGRRLWTGGDVARAVLAHGAVLEVPQRGRRVGHAG